MSDTFAIGSQRIYKTMRRKMTPLENKRKKNLPMFTNREQLGISKVSTMLPQNERLYVKSWNIDLATAS